MIAEADELIKMNGGDKKITIKVPMTLAGLETTRYLSKKGVKVNVTLIFTVNQALLAARAGAAYVSPFLGRLDDISEDGVLLVSKIAELFRIHQLDAQIIAASVRHPDHSLHARRHLGICQRGVRALARPDQGSGSGGAAATRARHRGR